MLLPFSKWVGERLQQSHGPPERWHHLDFKEGQELFRTVGKIGTPEDIRIATVGKPEGWGLIDTTWTSPFDSYSEGGDRRPVLGQRDSLMYYALGLLEGLIACANVPMFSQVIRQMNLKRLIDSQKVPTHDNDSLKGSKDLLNWLCYQVGREGDVKLIETLKSTCEEKGSKLSLPTLYAGFLYRSRFQLLIRYSDPDCCRIALSYLNYARKLHNQSNRENRSFAFPAFRDAIKKKCALPKPWSDLERWLDNPSRAYGMGFHAARFGFSNDIAWFMEVYGMSLQTTPPTDQDSSGTFKQWEFSKGLLMGAAYTGKKELLEWLFREDEGMNMLQTACVPSVNGVRVNYTDMELQQIVLCVAANEGHLHVVQWLTKEGVYHGRALLDAIRGGQFNTFLYLRQEGVLPSHEDALRAAREENPVQPGPLFHLLMHMGTSGYAFRASQQNQTESPVWDWSPPCLPPDSESGSDIEDEPHQNQRPSPVWAWSPRFLPPGSESDSDIPRYIESDSDLPDE
uniref:Uncharacterized protein n=1 Tax=Chromera velia CCMP2878 TaxID=1169474 RepID=A0A0G4GHU5_9ALVE|eukprot:Cvel_4732.t1-p1 / transcript=Cvel_4732.t1 / gene=Cvel_4732 / organism=Chromera_velia_CCMP2878 / gene_product=hypothetical protein / transcript_product=hypothetical protein / location=Cvel_scaffold210:75003-77777(+) / protein_length=511 / sequence_SO=supercontig / SO=protein_coding / is_pseudo=false